MSNIKNWSTTPASNNSASPNGAPEGMSPSSVNDIMRQQMADHRTQWQDAEWFDWGHVPTRTGNAVFTVPTDQTAVYTANRRLKCSDASTIYASILSSSYTAVTTITVVTDSGNLSASLTAVAVGIMTGVSVIPSDTNPVVSGSADASKKLRFEVDGFTTATTRVVTVPDRDVTINSLSPIIASLGADVALNNTANYFDGPSIAQGSLGTWFVSGTVALASGAASNLFHVKLTDGTSVIASTVTQGFTGGSVISVSLSGYLATPAGNLRISVKDATATDGVIKFNSSGNSKDSTITAIRVV